jgi:hypothetical protein
LSGTIRPLLPRQRRRSPAQISNSTLGSCRRSWTVRALSGTLYSLSERPWKACKTACRTAWKRA